MFKFPSVIGGKQRNEIGIGPETDRMANLRTYPDLPLIDDISLVQ